DEGPLIDHVQLIGFQEKAAGEGPFVEGADVAEGEVAVQAVPGGAVEPRVPAVQLAAVEVERKDDAGVEELVLVGGVLDLPLPVREIEAQPLAEALLDAVVLHVVALGDVEELAA